MCLPMLVIQLAVDKHWQMGRMLITIYYNKKERIMNEVIQPYVYVALSLDVYQNAGRPALPTGWQPYVNTTQCSAFNGIFQGYAGVALLIIF